MFINNQDTETILAARRSFLYHQDEPWVKIGSEDFDVPMGSFDGAEICEIVGLYLLFRITQKRRGIINSEGIGIYRDDGLIIVRGGAIECERIAKKLHNYSRKKN